VCMCVCCRWKAQVSGTHPSGIHPTPTSKLTPRAASDPQTDGSNTLAVKALASLWRGMQGIIAKVQPVTSGVLQCVLQVCCNVCCSVCCRARDLSCVAVCVACELQCVLQVCCSVWCSACCSVYCSVCCTMCCCAHMLSHFNP